MSRRSNVRSGPVLRTGNPPSSGLGGPLSRVQAVRLEQTTARRRDAEARRREFWTHTSNYFKVHDRRNGVYDGWNAPEVKNKSESNYHRERDRLAESEAKEEERLNRRNLMLDEARKEFEAETKLNSGAFRRARAAAAPANSLGDLRDQYERLQKARFERQQKEVEEKMLQHYRINNPEFRDLQFKARQRMVQKAWEDQVKRNLEKKEEEEKENEERKRREMVEREKEAERRREEEVVRRQQVEVWKAAVEEQRRELARRKEEEARVEEEIALENRRQKELFEAESRRRKAEELRKGKEAGEYLRRQHRVRLLAKARSVEEELEEDRKILEDVANFKAEAASKERESRTEQLEWLKDVLIQQKEEERKRRKEMDLLFTEEAQSLWEKQETTWNQEKEARKKLMDDVLSTLAEQTREKLKLKERRKEDIATEKRLLEERIATLRRDIEDEERERLLKAELFVQDLDKQVEEKEKAEEEENVTLKDVMVWEQKCRERNELAQKLTKMATEGEDKEGIMDFRRKKVRWY